MVVGEYQYTTLEKVTHVSSQMWDIVDLNNYCIENRMDWFHLDDYCDLVNGNYSEEHSIDLPYCWVEYCHVNMK